MHVHTRGMGFKYIPLSVAWHACCRRKVVARTRCTAGWQSGVAFGDVAGCRHMRQSAPSLKKYAVSLQEDDKFSLQSLRSDTSDASMIMTKLYNLLTRFTEFA